MSKIDEIRQRKKKLKLTTYQLALLAELPQGTVSKILTGETKNPSYPKWQELVIRGWKKSLAEQ